MYKMLIVDDEYEIRTGLINYFPWDEIGFEVVGEASNGREALDFISAHPVDVMLCDIKMPVVSGLEVAQQLYQQKSTIKLVLLSGYKEFEYARQAISYGVEEYIVKPTKYKEIYELFTTIRMELDEHYAAPKPASFRPDSNEPLSYNDRIINRVKSYVLEHYQQATLHGASEVVLLNPNYLSKFFKEKTGQNFSDYLCEVRMHKAAEFLMDVHLKTYEISELVGYKNPKNFTRAFKKFFGKSPKDYRDEGTLQ